MRGLARPVGGRAHPVRRQRGHDRGHAPDRQDRDHQPRRGPERLDDDRRARRSVAARGRGSERGADGRGPARPGAGRGARAAELSGDPRVRRAHRDRRSRPPCRRGQGGARPSSRAGARTPPASSRTAHSGRRSPTRRGTSGSTGRRPPNIPPRCAPPTAPARVTPRLGSPRLSDIDPAALAERAATKAESSAKPRDLPPARTP